MRKQPYWELLCKKQMFWKCRQYHWKIHGREFIFIDVACKKSVTLRKMIFLTDIFHNFDILEFQEYQFYITSLNYVSWGKTQEKSSHQRMFWEKRFSLKSIQ